MYSILMAAKNAEKYIEEACAWTKKIENISYELIIVDDHSTDKTLQIIEGLCKENNNIKLYKNNGHGKINALNKAFSESIGTYIKFIDADDIFNANIFFENSLNKEYDVLLHSLEIVDEDGKYLANYSVNPNYINKSKKFCIGNLISIPRCCFCLKKNIANHIFPLPAEIEFEDIWISLIAKMFLKNIVLLKEKNIYFYRQHSQQSYGGIISFDRKILEFRAKKIINAIDYIENIIYFKNYKKELGYTKKYYLIIIDFKWKSLLVSEINIIKKIKILIILKYTKLAVNLLKIKWYIDKFR